MIIGPDVFNDTFHQVKKLHGNLKDASSFGLNPATNLLRARNLTQAKDLMSQLYGKLVAVRNTVSGLQDVVDKSYQTADQGLTGCIFSGDPACSQLVYNNWIYPAYRYTPPPGFGGLPVPIIFIVQNDKGEMFFGLPAFLPAQ